MAFQTLEVPTLPIANTESVMLVSLVGSARQNAAEKDQYASIARNSRSIVPTKMGSETEPESILAAWLSPPKVVDEGQGVQYHVHSGGRI